MERQTPDHYLPTFNKNEDGCEFSTSCFTCSLPECVWDLPNGEINRLRTELKHQNILKTIQAEGLTAEEAAVRFGLNIRTIRRMQGNA